MLVIETGLLVFYFAVLVMLLFYPLALAGYVAAFVAYASALKLHNHPRWRLGMSHVLLGAVLFRLVMLVSEIHFSDDVWRYLWDGHVQTWGINPYQHAPADFALTGLRTDFWPRINHPEVPSIYPHAAQLVFGVCAAAGGGSPRYVSSWLARRGWVFGRCGG